MYTTFFGCRHKPFQLVPDPAFLFLSQGHEEAMAHLRYAVAHGDGFAAITGEVGTGKTTLCRAFLDNLGDDTEAAYIFNPRLNDIQLLQSINDEFGIDAGAESVKDLIDELNRFLMAQRQAGKTVLLLIDEAQNLSASVLEQLRLLSNLETTTAKLLQIILLGQPELEELLNSHHLRQLTQRITLRCRLRPMSANETRDYIRHRLNRVCPDPRVVFTRRALRRVHGYANGIPRLINIVCERALLTAFTLEQHTITGRTVAKAIRELTDLERPNPMPFVRSPAIFMAVVALVGVVVILVLFPGILGQHQTVSLHTAIEPQPPPNQAVMPRPIVPEANKTQRLKIPPPLSARTAPITVDAMAVILQDMESRASMAASIQQILALWQIKPGSIRLPLPDATADASLDLRLAFGRHGMQLHPIAADLSLIEQLDLPAILALTVDHGPKPRFMVVCGMTDALVWLQGEAGPLPVQRSVLELFATGQAYVPWKNFRALNGTIPVNAGKDATLTLQLLLKDLGLIDTAPSPDYDAVAGNAVLAAQARHGIDIDGIVGPATKIVLYNEDPSLDLPHLSGNRQGACQQPKMGVTD